MNIFDETRKHYNAAGVHPTTDPDNPRSQFAVERYEDYLPKLIKPGMRALDLGCNAGRYTFAMEDMGARATGIDFAEIPLLHAKKVAEKRKSRCQFNIADMAALPYKENSFDFALLLHNIGYLPYQTLESLSVQLKRILSDNGIFVLTMQDQLVKGAGEETLPERYDVQTGLISGSRTIPDKGTYASPWYFWTVAFAKYIFEKHLPLEEVGQIEENRFMLVFRNKKGTEVYQCHNKTQ
jgi:ubiquinone/menaquinone biosynthesis C-methylase UbiE